ncbi:DUF1016 N-terminal domain-containing protein [Ventosimonas gracilis]|uniref:DUF1016 N-terminal domain-containing protein n=1 Tax=Ventosimonas gracilis TaxID=1680762 RepID=UPI0009A22791
MVEQLSADLRTAFPGIAGFSASNLWRMKGFFETYRDAIKLAPLVREIGYSPKGKGRQRPGRTHTTKLADGASPSM